MKNNYTNRLHILLLATILLFTSLVNAQDYIDEDYLGKLESNAKMLLDQAGSEFKVTSTPAKWDKESAVVIGYSRSVLFDRKTSGGFLARKSSTLWFIEKNQFRIKVNDKNAVLSFSQIYFRAGAKEDGFVARIIKPDGVVVTVDLKTAVGVEDNSNVPEYFQSFFDKVTSGQYRYYKVPVADLEPGDILEYIASTKSQMNVTSSGYIEFSPVYEVCSKNYPIMFNEIIIETDGKAFFKYLSLNGAPRFTKEDASEGFFRYVFVDRNRETEKDVNFVSPILQYPMVKFQVIYSNKEEVKGAFIGAKGELKSEFAREELAKKAWENYEAAGNNYYSGTYMLVKNYVKDCWKELNKIVPKSATDQQFIELTYYFLRNKILYRNNYLSDITFAYMFSSLLEERDIKPEIVITIANNIGKLNQVLFDNEIRYIVKVGDKLYFNATDYSNPGELDETLLNNEAYIISAPERKTDKQEIRNFVLPGTKAADNSEQVTFKTELSSDMKNLLVIRTSSYTGIQKARSIVDALKFTPYIFDDHKIFGGNSPSYLMRGKPLEDYDNSIRALKEQFKKQKPEQVKESLESEYRQRVNDIHFDLLSDGRSPKKTELVVKEGFSLPGFTRKAGKKYLLNLASLIGSQIQIKKEERNRKIDIDTRYPKTLDWVIQFKIPAGYKVEGLKELANKVDNPYGTFSIEGKEEAGTVIINMRKVYKEKNIPKEKWSDVLAFLDAAYNSQFKYILLSPI